MPAVHPGIVTPQMVAKMGASLDRISGGRCAINIVNGWWKDEFNLFGNGTWLEREDDRYRRMDEYLQVMKGLWTAGRVLAARRILPCRGRQRADKVDATAASADLYRQPLGGGEGHRGAALRRDGSCGAARTPASIERTSIDTMPTSPTWISAPQSYGRTIRYGINCHVICDDTMEARASEADRARGFEQKPLSASIAKALGGGLSARPTLIAERIMRYEDSASNA